MNRVEISGRLTKDPEVKKTQQGTSVCTFTVAVDRRGEGQQTADFIQCVAWKGSADYLRSYGKKGDWVEVEGSITTRNYENSDGRKVYVTEVNANNVKLIKSKQKEDENIWNAEITW